MHFTRTPPRARDGVSVDTESGQAPKRCGAQTRKGTPCRAKTLPGKTRCKMHGGLSTAPKTQEGRERIAEAQRRRWARHDTAKRFNSPNCYPQGSQGLQGLARAPHEHA
ncbi:HGGxSTG domain-containing protein [Rhodovulum marinum]|uniref:HGGxSTG domain-containing protein n=1 Tax=Rhodovulum marinum TaxID=320662 RepID=UPI0024428E63|nr:HGGxSTG domain-containing protein [Rhodovulum marinum]